MCAHFPQHKRAKCAQTHLCKAHKSAITLMCIKVTVGLCNNNNMNINTFKDAATTTIRDTSHQYDVCFYPFSPGFSPLHINYLTAHKKIWCNPWTLQTAPFNISMTQICVDLWPWLMSHFLLPKQTHKSQRKRNVRSLDDVRHTEMLWLIRESLGVRSQWMMGIVGMLKMGWEDRTLGRVKICELSLKKSIYMCIESIFYQW